MHLTDEQLNEYLDNESDEHVQIEAHLSACADCTARLMALQTLFAEVESLPEVALSGSLAVPFTVDSNVPLPQSLRWLTWTTSLQAAVAVIALITTAPLIMQLLSPYFSGVHVLSSAEIFLELQSIGKGWLDLFSQLRAPVLPSMPVVELSSLVIVLTLVGVSALWLIGNGLLLRNQIK